MTTKTATEIHKQLAKLRNTIEKLPTKGDRMLSSKTWIEHFELTNKAEAVAKMLRARLDLISSNRVSHGMYEVWYEPRGRRGESKYIKHVSGGRH